MPTPVAFIPPKAAGLRRQPWAIDVRDAGLDAVDELKDFRGIIRIQRAGKAVADGVRYVQRFAEIAHADYGEDRAEDLFLRNGGVRRDVIENGRRNKIAAIVSAACEALAAKHELSFFFANLDITEIGFHLRLVNSRPHIDAGLKTVAGL